MKSSLSDLGLAPDLPLRFADRVFVDGDCWVWSGHPQTNGYYQFRYEGSIFSVHRFAYERLVHRLEPGRLLMNREELCGRKNCVNPDHWHTAHARVRERF
jgi:hypothetical protein